ncbi:MAG: acyloxyacyl hydrolase [Rhodospirillales bacterium]
MRTKTKSAIAGALLSSFVLAGAAQAAETTGGSLEAMDAEGGYGFLSEIKVGAFKHDFGPFGAEKEDGFSGNVEVLFTSPEFLDIILAPRPHLGATIHSEGKTHQGYFGLTWTFDFLEDFYFDFSFGGSVHTGNLHYTPGNEDEKNLGCRLLFRESAALGYRVTGNHNVSLHLDHISNAKLCDENEGLDNVGIRYGYRF